MDTVLSEDIPKLLKQFPQNHSTEIRDNQNPFDDDFVEPDIIPANCKEKATEIFKTLGPENGKLPGKTVREVLMQSSLQKDLLSKIWNLSDRDKDGALNLDEVYFQVEFSS
eukprot:TRINITY_DN5468_c0_g2_i1.p1 TRINITY_DN5468_c0_g2~~TRINITY_DN5468_c0_g2_i1.p1  ORF type:complete len:111 (-),score=38.43 TRINITY_DN5468_c0_g2_i1:110-442(-)